MVDILGAVSAGSASASLIGLWSFSFGGHSTCRTRSPPGHLVHLVRRGGYRLTLRGHTHQIEAGHAIWFHDGEAHAAIGDGRRVEFWSCAFHLPDLLPPASHKRVWHAEPALRDAFNRSWELLDRCRDALQRELLAQSQAAEVAAMLCHRAAQPGSLWDQAEAQAAACGFDLSRLASHLDTSISSLHRACQLRHQSSPGRRLRAFRLDCARAMIQQTPLPIAEIAVRCGYRCSQDLARAFRKAFGRSPSSLRG